MSSHPPAGFLSLPRELTDRIADLAGRDGLLALNLTSRFIHKICMRLIYRVVCLRDGKKLIACCNILCRNSARADEVREFILVKMPPNVDPQLLSVAIRACRNLRVLEVPGIACLESIPLDMHFPQLRRLSTPAFSGILDFLSRHTTLEELTVPWGVVPAPRIELNDMPPSAPLLCTLSSLKYYNGLPELAPLIIPGSRVDEVVLSFDRNADVDEIDRTVAALRHSNKPIRILNGQTFDSPRTERLVRLLGASFGSLECLVIHCFFVRESQLPRVFSAFTTVLKNLPHLETLSITRQSNSWGPESKDTRAFEFEYVRRCSESSPRLQVCVLPSGVSWLRLSSGVWIPWKRDFYHVARLNWFVKAVVEAGDSLPSGYLRTAEEMVGSEPLKRLEVTLARGDQVRENYFSGFASVVHMT